MALDMDLESLRSLVQDHLKRQQTTLSLVRATLTLEGAELSAEILFGDAAAAEPQPWMLSLPLHLGKIPLGRLDLVGHRKSQKFAEIVPQAFACMEEIERQLLRGQAHRQRAA